MKAKDGKTISLLTILVMILSMFSLAAASSYISGTSSSRKTFYVNITGSYGSIVLKSYQGTAMVSHNTIFGTSELGQENTHGFYTVSVSHSSGYSDTTIWCPSGTVFWDNYEQKDQLTISFPGTGIYTVTVSPIDDPSNYWVIDTLQYWITDASWAVNQEFGCECSADYTEVVIETPTCHTQPPTCVWPTPTPDPYVNHGGYSTVQPANWDTQFKPGTTSADKYNTKRYEKLGNLSDNNYRTAFDWLVWKSERTDDIPELSAYFFQEKISSIGIRNGNLGSYSEYWQYARVSTFRVTIYDYYGGVYETYITIPDEYSTEYWVFPLGGTYSDVTCVKLWLEGFNTGNSSENKNVIRIADIQFYR